MFSTILGSPSIKQQIVSSLRSFRWSFHVHLIYTILVSSSTNGIVELSQQTITHQYNTMIIHNSAGLCRFPDSEHLTFKIDESLLTPIIPVCRYYMSCQSTPNTRHFDIFQIMLHLRPSLDCNIGSISAHPMNSLITPIIPELQYWMLCWPTPSTYHLNIHHHFDIGQIMLYLRLSLYCNIGSISAYPMNSLITPIIPEFQYLMLCWPTPSTYHSNIYYHFDICQIMLHLRPSLHCNIGSISAYPMSPLITPIIPEFQY